MLTVLDRCLQYSLLETVAVAISLQNGVVLSFGGYDLLHVLAYASFLCLAGQRPSARKHGASAARIGSSCMKQGVIARGTATPASRPCWWPMSTSDHSTTAISSKSCVHTPRRPPKPRQQEVIPPPGVSCSLLSPTRSSVGEGLKIHSRLMYHLQAPDAPGRSTYAGLSMAATVDVAAGEDAVYGRLRLSPA